MKIPQPARFLGRANIIDCTEELDIWNCPECDRMFHAVKKIRGKTTRCMNCKEEVVLDPFAFESQAKI